VGSREETAPQVKGEVLKKRFLRQKLCERKGLGGQDGREIMIQLFSSKLLKEGNDSAKGKLANKE